MTYSPDGKTLLAGGGSYHSDVNCWVRRWDAATGEPLGPPLSYDWCVRAVAYSPDGKRFLVGSGHREGKKGQAQLYDAATGQPVGTPLLQHDIVLSLAFCPDGRTLAARTASDWNRDPQVRLWGTADGSPLQGATLPHPRESPAASVDFSPDGTLLVVGPDDGSAQLWDLATYRPLGPPVVQSGRLLGVVFAADGQSFLTKAEDGTTRVWPVPVPLDEPNLEQLALELEVRTGLRMDEGQAVARLTVEEWRQRRQKLAERGSATVVRIAPPPSDRDWHDARARDAEQTGQSFTARWHLDQRHLARTRRPVPTDEAPSEERTDASAAPRAAQLPWWLDPAYANHWMHRYFEPWRS